jgi:hypothetical protein
LTSEAIDPVLPVPESPIRRSFTTWLAVSWSSEGIWNLQDDVKDLGFVGAVEPRTFELNRAAREANVKISPVDPPLPWVDVPGCG